MFRRKGSCLVSLLTLLAFALPAAAARRDLSAPGIVAPLTGPQAGDSTELALGFVRDRAGELGLAPSDLDDMRLVDSYVTKHNGVTHVYLRQRLDGIEVFNGDIAVHVARDGSILKLHSLFAPELRQSANVRVPALAAEAAIAAAAQHLGVELRQSLVVEEQMPGPERAATYRPAGISRTPIPTRLVYRELADGAVRLAWEVGIYEIGEDNWWNTLIDAESGTVLEKHNRVDHDSYAVYALPAASPIHVAPIPPADGRTLVVDPADPTASPYGWHTTTTTPGEFQATRGNNVDAYEDHDNSNDPTGGDAARAIGTGLDFDFPLDHIDPPEDSVSAIVTNLFYMNNMIHDILYRYGFDEASGNFQSNNYGNGGDGGDDVRAEAQDGGGRNNANFATQPDGQRPRMQMYLWDPPSAETLTVHSPASIARDYTVAGANFGPPVPNVPGIIGDLVMVDDGSADPTFGCSALVNGAEIAGNIAVADLGLGGCNAGIKALNAEAAGATALIVINGSAAFPIFRLNSGSNPGIPTAMIGFDDGDLIRAELGSGSAVNGTLANPLAGNSTDHSSSLDNEIVIHEYGHGISNRLVGGRDNTDCLSVQEQAGEGWSDLFGLMLTVEPGDAGTDVRGFATYSVGQLPTGTGLRAQPYSTDMAVSPLTYGGIAGRQRPHETGALWASAGWEVYWAMTDRYGFDPDLINGAAGNNLAIQLIVDGLKFTPCSPGFVDDRDAVLMANQVNNGGVNLCLLWEAFAKRGLGFSADQGDAATVGDETEAFNLPPECACPAAVDLGNVVRAWSAPPAATDVQLSFVGAPGDQWEVFRDEQKESLRTTSLAPAPSESFTDSGAVNPAAGTKLYYRVAEVDCLGDAGP